MTYSIETNCPNPNTQQLQIQMQIRYSRNILVDFSRFKNALSQYNQMHHNRHNATTTSLPLETKIISQQKNRKLKEIPIVFIQKKVQIIR